MLYESAYYGVVPLGDTLIHHGIRGQKWHHRRWQNEDGSLTPAGRIHYGVGEARKRKVGLDENGIKALKDAKTFNTDKWGVDQDHNVLYVTGQSGSGKSTAALNAADKDTDIIQLDMYTEKMDSEDTNAYQSKAFNEYLNKKRIPYQKISDGSYNDENGVPYNNKEWWKLLNRFTKATEDFGKHQYGKGRRVIVEGLQLADGTMYDDVSVLKGKPVAVMNAGAIKSTIRATKRDIGYDFRISDIPRMLDRIRRKQTTDSKAFANLKRLMKE